MDRGPLGPAPMVGVGVRGGEAKVGVQAKQDLKCLRGRRNTCTLSSKGGVRKGQGALQSPVATVRRAPLIPSPPR